MREKVMFFLHLRGYNNVQQNRRQIQADEEFGIHDDLLNGDEEEEDAKILHDQDISKASASSSSSPSRQ